MIDKVSNIFFGPAPYEGSTKKGTAVSMAKRVIIGLVASGAIAAAIYFLNITINSAWNPFNYSADTLKVLSIVSSVGCGIVGLVATTFYAYNAWSHRPSGQAYRLQ